VFFLSLSEPLSRPNIASASNMSLLEMGLFGNWLFGTIFIIFWVFGLPIALWILQAKAALELCLFMHRSFIWSTVFSIMFCFFCVFCFSILSSSLTVKKYNTLLDCLKYLLTDLSYGKQSYFHSWGRKWFCIIPWDMQVK